MSRAPAARWLDLVPLAAAVWLVVDLARTWAARIPHPYDLEWMEGGMLAHAWRVSRGLPLYVEPGPGFVPFIYPPGYASLVAAVGAVFGLDYAPARVLSLIGVIGAAAAIVVGVKRIGGSAVVGVLAATAFLGCYPHSGAFYDLVRLDGVYVGLLAWSVVLGTSRARGALEGSALLLAAAFLFKQHVALFGIPMALGLWRRDGMGSAIRFAAWSALPALAATGALSWSSEGRYLEYLLGVPGSHPLVGHRILPGTPRELGWALPAGLVGLTVWALARTRRWLPDTRAAWRFGVPVTVGVVAAGIDLWVGTLRGLGHVPPTLGALGTGCVAALLVTLGWTAARGRTGLSWGFVYGAGVGFVALASSALMRGHHGGFLNVQMQLHWVTAFALGVAFARWRRDAPRGAVVALTAGLFALQIGGHAATFDRASLVPTEADRAAGDRLVAALREVEGPVWSPYAPWLPAQAGFEPGLHLIAVWDVTHDASPFPGVERRLSRAVAARHWGAVVDGPRPLRFGVQKHYRVHHRVQAAPGVFVPKTGWRARPKAILVPRDAPEERP